MYKCAIIKLGPQSAVMAGTLLLLILYAGN